MHCKHDLLNIIIHGYLWDYALKMRKLILKNPCSLELIVMVTTIEKRIHEGYFLGYLYKDDEYIVIYFTMISHGIFLLQMMTHHSYETFTIIFMRIPICIS